MRTLIALAALLLAAPAAASGLVATDGDSVRNGPERLRLENIDAPELSRPQCRSERLAAEAAKEALQAHLDAGPVEIVRTGRDRYGRTLARLYGPQGDIGRAMVAEGHARPWEGRRRPWCR